MKLDFWSIVSLGLTTLVVFVGLLNRIHKLIRYRRKNGKAVTPVSAESKGDSLRFFSLSLVGLTTAFSALLLLSVQAQPSIPSRALSLLAAIAAASNVLAVLVVLLGIPAYNYILNLKQEQVALVEEVKALRELTQRLAEKVQLHEAQANSLPPPVPRKPSVRKKKSSNDKQVSSSRRRSDKKKKV